MREHTRKTGGKVMNAADCIERLGEQILSSFVHVLDLPLRTFQLTTFLQLKPILKLTAFLQLTTFPQLKLFFSSSHLAPLLSTSLHQMA